MLNRLPMLFTSVAVGIVFAGAALVMIGSEVKARPIALETEPTDMMPNAAISSVYKEMNKAKNQADVRVALKKVRQLLSANELRSSADFTSASSILIKGLSAEDSLLAHDLAICALALGDTRAKDLAAASQDQFLARINRKQRFGTQVRNKAILPTDAGIPDSIRFILGVPSLLESRKRVALGTPFKPLGLEGVSIMPMAKTIQAVAVVAD